MQSSQLQKLGYAGGLSNDEAGATSTHKQARSARGRSVAAAAAGGGGCLPPAALTPLPCMDAVN